MNAYKFAGYPSSSSVASGVTILVSVWFLVAAGAILSDPSSPYTQRKEVRAAAPVKTASAALVPQMHDTIHVSAKRSAT